MTGQSRVGKVMLTRFYINLSPYCTDAGGNIYCNIPNNALMSDDISTRGVYQGFSFSKTGDLFTLTRSVINEQHFISISNQTESDCFNCTAYDYSYGGSDNQTCYLFDRSIDNLSFSFPIDHKNSGFLLSRSPQCYVSANTIICGTPTGTTVTNTTVSGDNPGIVLNTQNGKASDETVTQDTLLVLKIVLPLSLLFLPILGIVVFVYCTKSMGRNSVVKKTKSAISAKLHSNDNSSFALNSQLGPNRDLQSVLSMDDATPHCSIPNVSEGPNPTDSGDQVKRHSLYSNHFNSVNNMEQRSSRAQENNSSSQDLGFVQIVQQEIIEQCIDHEDELKSVSTKNIK
ncbi:hypothetical protein HDV06_007065 [Boothiomyces sp. JEL0866]|nr:hypothetical protein HDV06_007065 [Boothiomyces sp. JEL0866]